MKKTSLTIFCIIATLGYIKNLEAQGVLKRLENKVTKSVNDSIKKKEEKLENKILEKADYKQKPTTKVPFRTTTINTKANGVTDCENPGNETIAKGHKAYMQYRSVEKKLKLQNATRKATIGIWLIIS
ncbi:hypothetical protein ACFQ1Q_02800 [Winogradskyella litorisediminis]|uniref:Uncharacterized protein n=1 Tax=Winogradskyella litorisediminis TaxID=1156618 RepID=A0ABW3N375_9FLAO